MLFGKEISFKDLECVCKLYPSCKAQAPYYIFICGLFSLCLIVYITLNTLFWKNKLTGNVLLNFCYKVCFLLFLHLEELPMYCDSCNYAFYKIPDIFLGIQRLSIFLDKVLRNIAILNFMNFIQWNPSCCNLKDWHEGWNNFAKSSNIEISFLMSFHWTCMELLTFTSIKKREILFKPLANNYH